MFRKEGSWYSRWRRAEDRRRQRRAGGRQELAACLREYFRLVVGYEIRWKKSKVTLE